MEEAFSISDSLHTAAEHLHANPTVSGPAANPLLAAVNEYRHRYEGLTLTPQASCCPDGQPRIAGLRLCRADACMLL